MRYDAIDHTYVLMRSTLLTHIFARSSICSVIHKRVSTLVIFYRYWLRLLLVSYSGYSWFSWVQSHMRYNVSLNCHTTKISIRELSFFHSYSYAFWHSFCGGKVHFPSTYPCVFHSLCFGMLFRSLCLCKTCARMSIPYKLYHFTWF